MKSAARQSGYTVIEVLIYLAVVGLLLLSAMILVGGQQNKAEFNQGIRDLDAQFQDVLNDIAVGYYPKSDTFECKKDPVDGSVGPAVEGTGTNVECIFLGKVIHFTTVGDIMSMQIQTTAGLRLEASTWNPSAEQEVTAISSTKPALATTLTEEYTLKYGLQVTKILVDKSGFPSKNALGFLGTFAKYDPDHPTDLISGSLFSDLYVLPAITTEEDKVNEAVKDLKNTADAQAAYDDGVNGVIVCVERNGGAQKGSIEIGAVGGRLTTRLEIGNRRTECDI